MSADIPPEANAQLDMKAVLHTEFVRLHTKMREADLPPDLRSLFTTELGRLNEVRADGSTVAAEVSGYLHQRQPNYAHIPVTMAQIQKWYRTMPLPHII